MARTDKFRPSVIDPRKFVFVANHYLGHSEEAWEALCGEMQEEAERLEAHQAAHPGHVVAGHKWPGICDCCGARYLYGATFYTEEANTYISVGGICAGKLGLGSEHAMKTFREQINTWKVHAERVAIARAFVIAHNIGAALDLYLSKDNSNEFPERTLRDMIGKLVRWGSISEKQIAFAAKLITQIADRPRLEAERAAKDEARQPCPISDKRLTIEGTIISAKYSEGGFEDGKEFFQPEGIKIVIEHADGWRVWGSCPTNLYSTGYSDFNVNGAATKYVSGDDAAATLKGKRVRLDARVTRSDKDSKFGFFKRPTKGQFITEELVA